MYCCFCLHAFTYKLICTMMVNKIIQLKIYIDRELSCEMIWSSFFEQTKYDLLIIEDGILLQVGVAAFDLRSASLHLSQYIETSCSYHNTKTLLHFYDPMVVIVPPNKTAADGMVGVSELIDKHYPANKKVFPGFIIHVFSK